MKLVSMLMVVLMLLSGCATAPKNVSLKPQQVSAAKVARVFLVVPQDKPMGYHEGSTAGQKYKFSAISIAIDLIETSSAYKRMLETVGPVHRATPDLNIRQDLRRALSNSGLFVSSNAVQVVENPPTDEAERQALLASARGIPVVWIEAVQRFSPTYHSLIIESRLSLRLTPQSDESYSVRTLYQSAPVSPDRSFISGHRQTARWAANNASKYRSAYAEGIAETVKMLRIAILNRPSNLAAPTDRVHEFFDYATFRSVRGKGKLIQAGQDRGIFLTEDGDFHSLSTGPTYASASARLAMPSPGYGRVFFYWAYIEGSYWIQPSIYVNDTKVGEFAAGAFFYKDLRPGRYSISLRYDGDEPGSTVARSQMLKVVPVDLDVAANGQFFVKFDGYQGLFTKTDTLKIAAHKVAETEIQPLRYFE